MNLTVVPRTLASLLFIVQLARPDEIRVLTTQGTERTYTGSVVDYRGDGLTLDLSGRETKFPSERVIAIQADWLPDHQAADAKFAEYDFAAALPLYGRAIRQESRLWVRRKLLAQLVRCQGNLAEYEDACKYFARLVDEDAETPYFDAIPLAWTANQPSQELEQMAAEWVVADQPAVRRLMAASWLLTSRRRAEGLRALRDLVRDPDVRVANLAMGQSWRAQLATAKPEDLADWQQSIRQMSFSLRAGPYFVLGKAYARLQLRDEAILALMRLPTTYPHDHELAQLALFESGKLLQEQGETSQALRLYRKTLTLGQRGFAAEQARQRIAALAP